jgi:hypothetical protein
MSDQHDAEAANYITQIKHKRRMSVRLLKFEVSHKSKISPYLRVKWIQTPLYLGHVGRGNMFGSFTV